MAEFQWWLLLVGLVAGGGLVAVVSMDARRREEDVSEMERAAEATWIADRLMTPELLDPLTIEEVLRAHRDYLALVPPDRIVVEEQGSLRQLTLDGNADRQTDDIGDDGRGHTDEDLAAAAEERAAAREQAHAGADREQGGDR